MGVLGDFLARADENASDERSSTADRLCAFLVALARNEPGGGVGYAASAAAPRADIFSTMHALAMLAHPALDEHTGRVAAVRIETYVALLQRVPSGGFALDSTRTASDLANCWAALAIADMLERHIAGVSHLFALPLYAHEPSVFAPPPSSPWITLALGVLVMLFLGLAGATAVVASRVLAARRAADAALAFAPEPPRRLTVFRWNETGNCVDDEGLPFEPAELVLEDEWDVGAAQALNARLSFFTLVHRAKTE